MVKKYTIISTFAGGGGSSLGYKMAGFDELLAIDFDKNAIETLKLNYNFPVWERNIKTVSGKEILDFCKLNIGDLDILDGSPPCQGFSTVGKRNVTDNRNDLFLDYSRLISELKPKVFVMENVSGMIKGTFKGKFNEILSYLKNLGYNVKCKLMNAMWYEVPQSRERVIFIGVRNDLNIEPSFPKPFTKVITVKEAIKDCPLSEIKIPKGDVDLYFDKIKVGFDLASYYESIGKKRKSFSIKKINPNKPLNTITKLFSASMTGLLHWNEKRYLTINELKRCSTFPDEYKFIGKFEQQWARIGNAVMPKMMYHIANNIKLNILDLYYNNLIKKVS